MERVLIAGSSGLAGSAILRFAPPHLKIYSPAKSELNLTNFMQVGNFLLENKIDTVILAAAKVGGIIANSQSHWTFLLENLKIESTVIEAAKISGVNNLLFLSSSCVYPRNAEQPMSEDLILTGSFEPTNEGYAIAKVFGMRLCKAAFDEFDLNYFSLTPPNLYGENDNFDSHFSHVPASLMRRMHEAKIRNDESVIIWGTGNVLREFMYVDDLAMACWFFVDKPFGGQNINVGTGKEISIRDFASLMASVVGFKGRLNFDPSKPVGMPRKVLDVTTASKSGWNASVDLEKGLRKTYACY